MEGGNVSDRRGGRVSGTGGDSRVRRGEGTRRPGGNEDRSTGQRGNKEGEERLESEQGDEEREKEEEIKKKTTR